MDFGINIALKYVYPFLAVLILVEFLYVRHLYRQRDIWASIGVAAVATLIAVFTKAVAVGIFFGIHELAEPLRASLFGYSTIGWAWWAWALCLLGDDFAFYWHHRFSHQIRVLWATHIVHHSAETYNLGIAVRNGWFITLYKPIFWLWLPLLGFEPLMIAACLIINATYQFFLHTQLVPSLGFIGKIFNNPWVHQVHHSCNAEYLDKNHSGILIIWDRIFGTFQDRKKSIKPKFGVLHGPNSYNPLKINLHEYQDIWKDVQKVKSWRHKFMYIFGPPGWSHDGSTMTAKQIQAAIARGEWPPKDDSIQLPKRIVEESNSLVYT